MITIDQSQAIVGIVENIRAIVEPSNSRCTGCFTFNSVSWRGRILLLESLQTLHQGGLNTGSTGFERNQANPMSDHLLTELSRHGTSSNCTRVYDSGNHVGKAEFSVQKNLVLSFIQASYVFFATNNEFSL